MASSSTTIQPTALPAQFLWPLRAAFWAVVVAAGLWLFSIATQMFWAYRFSPDNPTAYANAVLAADLKSTAALTPLAIEPAALARSIGNEFKESTFDFISGLAGKLAAFPARLNRSNGQVPRPGSAIATVGGLLKEDQVDKVMVALTANYIFGARTALFIAALPLAALVYVMAIADGLSARALRRACAGRESSSLYHRGKLSQSFLLATVYVCLLAFPRAIDPLVLLLPACLACALLARLQAKFYKKYL